MQTTLLGLAIAIIVALVAALVAGYLVYDQVREFGPKITIRFKDGSGLKAGRTLIQYNGVRIGEVKSVKLSEDLREVVVEVRRDAPDRATVAPGEEVLGLGVREEWIAAAVEPLAHIHIEGRDPARLVTIERGGERDEAPQVALVGDRPDLETHPT